MPDGQGSNAFRFVCCQPLSTGADAPQCCEPAHLIQRIAPEPLARPGTGKDLDENVGRNE